ncbi:MAG TPA: BrnA antitoxin family protein [bacterium]|jgi:predicted DNA binding CopG/RHH family protein|nr:BrnA antitoxin family protein [bacterium]
MKKPKTIPKFKSEEAEARFWNSHDSADYVDWSSAKRATFPNLKPSTQSIALRLPEGLLNAIKVEAHKMDMPYQSLMKFYLASKVKEAAIAAAK